MLIHRLKSLARLLICCSELTDAVHRVCLYSSSQLNIGTKETKSNQSLCAKEGIIETNDLGHFTKNKRMDEINSPLSSATRMECSSADGVIILTHSKM